MSLRPLIERRALIVCFGAGGVGKTTTAAALALGAALSGRRAIVLTIDPARALARALGLPHLGSDPEPIGSGIPLEAAMLDQKSAWDAFVRRHAASDELARRIIANAFYRELSTRFAGATEYVAIEELCRLHESGRYDTIVLDTPPSAHALDFARAPDKIDRLLEPEVVRFLTARAQTGIANKIIRRLEHATGAETLGTLADLMSLLEGLVGGIRERSRRARQLLEGEQTAFVLVTAADARVDPARALGRAARELSLPLGAIVFNRTHPVPVELRASESDRAIGALLDDLVPGPARDWIWRTIELSRRVEAVEREKIELVTRSAPQALHAEIPELDHDLHSLLDLRRVADLLLA